MLLIREAGMKAAGGMTVKTCRLSATAPGAGARVGLSAYAGTLLLLALRLWSAPLRVGEAPAAPEDLIELDIGEQPGGADLGQLGFGRKEQLLGFEHLVITRQPTPIASIGDPDRVSLECDSGR